jgi:hypothetical protein
VGRNKNLSPSVNGIYHKCWARQGPGATSIEKTQDISGHHGLLLPLLIDTTHLLCCILSPVFLLLVFELHINSYTTSAPLCLVLFCNAIFVRCICVAVCCSHGALALLHSIPLCLSCHQYLPFELLRIRISYAYSRHMALALIFWDNHRRKCERYNG